MGRSQTEKVNLTKLGAVYSVKRKGHEAPSSTLTSVTVRFTHTHDNHQRTLLEDFCGERFPLGYQVRRLSLPKLALYEPSLHGNPDRKRSRNIYGDLHHLDREVS
ncbi:Uncharacterised protein [Enterobacter asburiae]|uniref:Uncharacterized protein n=1 Tax=Enterobacter asburiae TaxID=61645 RepID=A0A376FE68_ENTAS|nr:Uncharacterised protein [Enterobacter asburiae]